MRLWIVLLLPVLLLAACATPLPPPERPAEELYQQRLDRLAAVTEWQTGGRMAINTPDENATVSMDWQESADRWTLNLRGPFGSGSVRLEGRDGIVTLRGSDGTVDQASDARLLLLHYTGYDLPMEVLRDWLRGVPAQAHAHSKELDEYGRLTRLEQLGWDVHYTAWDRVDGIDVPSRLTLDGPGINLRASLRNWGLRRD